MERRSPSITTARGRAADITAQSAEGDAETSDEVGDGAVVGDRFGVFIDPKNVVAFLDRANINLNERSVFHFLLTFPFYEHEWDIAGFLLNALFDDDDQDDDEEGDLGEDDEIVDEGLSW